MPLRISTRRESTMQDAATFGRFLKTKRRQQDLTQEELAQRAQCAAETIRKVEAGSRRASKSLAQHLADALQLEGDERTHFLHLARSDAAPEESKQRGGRASARTQCCTPTCNQTLPAATARSHRGSPAFAAAARRMPAQSIDLDRGPGRLWQNHPTRRLDSPTNRYFLAMWHGWRWIPAIPTRPNSCVTSSAHCRRSPPRSGRPCCLCCALHNHRRCRP